MGHTVVLPDEVYDRLAADARHLGLSPDGLLAELLARRYPARAERPRSLPPAAGSADGDLDSLRKRMSPPDCEWFDAFTGTWEAPPGFDPVELVRSHDD